MAVYFAVFNRRRATALSPATNSTETEKWESVKILPAKAATPLANGGLETANVVLLEAASVAEAQAGVRHFFGGSSDTPVIVTEAQFKES